MFTCLRLGLVPLAVLALAGFGAAPAGFGAEKSPAPAKATSASDLDEMAKVCHLMNDQKEKLAEMVREKQRTIDEWMKTNGPRLVAARKALADAVTSRKPDQVKACRDALDAIEKERADTVAKIDHDIMGVLTTQQRADWDGYKLNRDIVEKFQALDLTPDQLKKIKKVCTDAANRPVPAFVDAESEAKARKDQFDRAFAEVFNNVLTQDQRDAFLGNAPPAKPDTPKSKTPAKKPR